MKKAITLFAIAITLNVCVAYAGQKSEFNIEHLGLKGRAAYRKLFSAGIFRVGGVGYGGQTSEEELALYDLLAEKEVIEALKSLVNDASYEGGLYGLLGLSVTNVEEFNSAVEVYKSRLEPPARQMKEPFSDLTVGKGEVTTQSGCVILSYDWLKVVQNIQSGYYDKILMHRFGK